MELTVTCRPGQVQFESKITNLPKARPMCYSFFFQVFESFLLSLYDGWSLLGKDCFSKGPFRCLSFFNVDLVPNNDYGTFSSVPFLGFINIVSNLHIYLISDTDEIHQNFNYNLLSFFYYYYFLVPIF